MIRPTTGQLFGDGFYQNSAIIRIQKADLTGLTPSPNNTAESILAALIIKASQPYKGILELSNDEPLELPSGEFLEFDNRSLYERSTIEFWRHILSRKGDEFSIKHQFLVFLRASPTISYYTPIEPNNMA